MASELSGSAVAQRRTPRRALVRDLLLAFLGAWVVGVAYGMLVLSTSRWHEGAAWEREMLQWFHAWTLPPWLDALMLHIPLTGTNLTLLPIVVVVGWWLWRKKKQWGIIGAQLLVVCLGSLMLNWTMKFVLGRERPALFPRRGLYSWASYPSGHAIIALAVYFTVALLLYRARGWRWPFFVAPLVCLANVCSRLYLAVHWPTDLIGGLVIGLVWLAGTWRAFARHPAHRVALTPGTPRR